MKKTLTKLAIPVIYAFYAWPALALDAESGAQAAKPNKTPENLFGGSGSVFQTIANVLIFLTGAIAVLIIIFGGLRYVTSTGDATRVKQAKDTILYGVVGLVIAILAFAIVNFVVKSLT